MLYSAYKEENAPHTQGVALMLSKQAQNALIGWESHRPRIIKASFKTKKEGTSINIIQCYAPINDYNEDAKDRFYNRLQSIVEKYPTKDPTILMGDLNAKVGTDNTGYEDIMRRHGLGEKNENGERFANLCAFNKLVIGGTIFPHKRIQKTIWTSPDHTTQTKSTIFASTKSSGGRWKMNWKGIKEAVTSTCHEVLGHKKHHHKEWITVDTLDKIQERRNKKAAINISRTRSEKAKAQAEYTIVNKQVKKSIRTDKRKYVEDLAKTAEKAAREANMRQLYDITKKLFGNRRKPERPVKSKEGEVITNIEEQQNRWVEHFKELLNRPAPLNPPNIEAAPTDLPINVGPPTIEEISMAIRQIKSGKAAGPDNVPAEALKADTLTSEGNHGIQWTAGMQLDDLDFADDLAFLPQTQQQVQEKTTRVAAAVRLNINKGKPRFSDTITIDEEDLEDVKTFTYLVSIIDEHSGSDAYVKARIGKARAAYLQLKNILNSKQLFVNRH
ncbi:unnamed protein product [Schistosoma margrebowiei]|uniref:Endonuclease/exonuclease/phosphatase domain-containing protein n=1 Tax=Schistosoma margrebowiei TaxID=48269 RepID=A0A3P8BHE0_9TREM|nr:unnamed protein product [Schistosoma margrebowiei]